MTEHDLEQAILEFVSRPGYRPMKPRMIAARLGVPKDRAAELKQVIKRLVRRRQLTYGSNHLIQPPSAGQAAEKLVVGAFHRTQKGFGFVRPLEAAAAGVKDKDIFVPAKWSVDAADGDVVSVRLHKRRPEDPGPRGEIVEVIERETHQFVGTYSESHGGAYVQIDGTVFAQPIYVGDPGAKTARPGDKVVVEMIRFPSAVHDGEGVITEVLGASGQPGVDTLSIIREFNLPEPFAADALEEARREAEKFDEAALEGRKDLTGETILTIDPVDARDFDDAISLERLDNGNWWLGVHIADVSHFVRPATALDREAHNRGTSVYLPDRVLPMLPEIISNALASLQPGKTRYTKSVFMEFTPEGLRTHAEYHTAAIRSSKRLTYEQVDAFLADRPAWRRKLGAKVHALLERMHELAMVLRGRRLKHGALELNMPELKVELDSSGRVLGAHVVENTESHQIIEEFMLAANESVAEMLRDRGVAFLRRVHGAPSPLKIKALAEFIRELGFPVSGLESRFELQKL
ncbi:MAG: ribonuclease R family protein, partial [Thermoguttaceae bacterium]